jgi:ribosomal protein L40E
MTKNAGPVFSAITEFTQEIYRDRIFVGDNIPAKKLFNARSKYITRNDPIVVLIDDTLFGSAKDGLAISEDYIYAKDLIGDSTSVKISSIRGITSQSTKLGLLDIYFDGNLFTTLSSFDSEDRDFVVGILQIAHAASQKSSVIPPITSSHLPAKDTKTAVVKPKVAISSLLKETVACTECSVNLPTGAKFCLECGAKVIPRGICPECETKLPEHAKFCLECGTPVDALASKPTLKAEEYGTRLSYPTDFEIGEDATSSDAKNERPNHSIRVRNVTVGILPGEGRFTGYVGFDDIDEMSSLMIFLDDDETPLGYSIKTHDKSLAVNNCDGGNVDDFFLRDQLPEALKDKWNLVLLASIDIDEAEDEGVEHYIYLPDEEAESGSSFNIESDFSHFSQVGQFLAVHQVMGWFEWNPDVEVQLPLDKFLRGELTDGLLLSVDNIGFISVYETGSEQLCLIRS